MNNFIQPGDVIEFTAPGGGVVAGRPVVIGNLLVVPTVSADATVPFNGKVTGVYDFDKTTGEAWVEGATVYWNSSTNKMTTSGPGNFMAGVAVIAATSGATTGRVRLDGISREELGT